MSSIAIKIVDSNQSCTFTSIKRASRYIDRGIAEWVIKNKSIRFNRNHAQWVEPIQARCYTDGRGIATLDQVRGLPVTGNAINLFIIKRKRTA